MAIIPKFTLQDLCGAGYVFNARISDKASHWNFIGNPAGADAASGNLLISMGDMPILCSRDSNSQANLQLLYEAGYNFSAKIHRFNDEHDHIKQTRELIKQGWKMVTQHVFPIEEIAPEHCLVAPALLSYLNNKENLPGIVPDIHIPQRRVFRVDQLPEILDSQIRPPVVIKAVTDESTGGGGDIIICRTVEAIKMAVDYFRDCTRVIVEDYMKMRNNYCMNYAAASTGEIIYVGASEQIVNDEGKQYGNWIGEGIVPPDQAINAGYEVMKKAVSLGYVGFAGFDMAVLDDDTVKVFDLNFRYNASTVPLLIYDSVVKQIGKTKMLVHVWECQGTFKDLVKTARTAINAGYLIPTTTYHPTYSLRPQARPLLFGLLCGTTRDEVLELNDGLLRQGLV